MNSRKSVNETNLVNFSAELSSLNQLDTKDKLLSFPFDHMYACHSQASDRRQPLQLEKDVEVSAHCVISEEINPKPSSGTEISKLSDQLSAAVNQNKKLKDLLIYHLDLIQQQNEIIIKRDKLYQSLKQAYDNLKAKMIRMDRKIGLNQRHTPYPPTATITSGSLIKNEPGSSQVLLNSFTELLLPDKGSSFAFDKNKPFTQETFGIARTTTVPEATYTSRDVNIPPLVDPTVKKSDYKMIENKRTSIKKDKSESRSEALYTVTSNSGNTIIHRIDRKRRAATGLGSLSRMNRTPKSQIPETITTQSKILDEDESSDTGYSVNKKAKMMNTYGKSRSSPLPTRLTPFMGSLADRLKLIDTTPTGDDPYQLGEADMREQSPIPKLMLQKTNHGRMKICNDGLDGTKRIYDMPEPKKRFVSPYDQIKKEVEKTEIVTEPDLDLVKTEPEIDWRLYGNRPADDSSLCDFPFEDTTTSYSPNLTSLDATEFQELFSADAALNLELHQLELEATVKITPEKTKRRAGRTISLLNPGDEEEEEEEVEVVVAETKRGTESRRGRKRAFSATGGGKAPKASAKPRGAARGKASTRGKKSPVPGMMTNQQYHTLCCDADISWYFGLDPDLKIDDIDPPPDSQKSTVEVPRWREKPYTSLYTLEGTENVDDRVFEKRHHKLEAEERRQLRWHMRRIREQRHVERLRLRHRDSWCSRDSKPTVFTVWPRPQQDVKFIEITDTLPVMGFGEPVPDLAASDFMLPWVRTSRAQKRSKRSKTLH